MSTGVPNTVVVPDKRQQTCGSDKAQRHGDSRVHPVIHGSAAAPLGRHRVTLKFGQQIGQGGIRRQVALPAKPGKQMSAPFHEIGNARREPVGVQADPQHVNGWSQQF